MRLLMCAISIYGGFNPAGHSRLRTKGGILKALTIICCLLSTFLIAIAWADDGGAADKDAQAVFAKRAEKIFNDAKSKLQAEPNNAEALWQFARACYDWADFSTKDSQRADIANRGIDACRKLLAQDAKSTMGHYYLAMNLGQLAQTKSLGALKLVSQMETEFKLVLAADAKFDNAGADRNLGLLYWQAPGWPMSVGSKSKAREHLVTAMKATPDFPENTLNLIEAELKWGDKTGVTRDLKALNDFWPAAKKKFTGEEWAQSWADWEKRKAAAEKKAAGK